MISDQQYIQVRVFELISTIPYIKLRPYSHCIVFFIVEQQPLFNLDLILKKGFVRNKTILSVMLFHMNISDQILKTSGDTSNML